MFKGDNQINIDPKGRIAIPAMFRQLVIDASASQLVIAHSPVDNCAVLYTLSAWSEVEEAINNMKNTSQSRRFKRSVVGRSKDLKLDGAGRVLIPSSFQEKFGFDKELVIVGLGDKFELWSAQNWNKNNLDEFDEEDLALLLEEVPL